jgi:membrane protein required for colicin V production
LGVINKLLGGVFGVFRAILIISITLNLFQKINAHNTFVEKETLDKSKLYNPIQKVSKMIYPSIEEWFTAFKKEEFQLENDKKRK